VDIRQEATSAVGGYVESALWVLGWGSGIIVLILWFGLRSIPEVIRVVTPIVSAILITASIWYLFGVKMNVFHLVSLLLVVGIGIDYALFFNRKTDSENHALDCLAVWICNITTVIVFGLLFFSFQPVLIAIGGTVACGAFTAYLISASVANRTGRML
jgi:predicted exporter